ncbi:hypothetical protein BLOT_000106 [Blomia tropicalis]|nr:hypothetical protein BLOT_000106 [Blomia tropicalis]
MMRKEAKIKWMLIDCCSVGMYIPNTNLIFLVKVHQEQILRMDNYRTVYWHNVAAKHRQMLPWRLKHVVAIYGVQKK